MQSMNELYQQYARTVYKYLRSLCHNEDLAEELTQETFYQAIRSIGRFDGSCKVSTWLCAIAKNLYLSHQRKNPVHEDITETEIPVESAESAVLGSAGRLELLKKLHELPEPYREVMYLRVFGNLSFAELGAILGKTENWARVTFYRGKEKLRKEVENDE
ncbi:MAG: sigma-70 family RNA polymerase sigma factor [Lachnospiraceae bacterium]|nr:sigma-70 family RNA polymerase sigma factor [Lachnospiraceae bacterium]